MVSQMKLIVAIILIIALTSTNGISQQLTSTKIIGRVIDTTESGVPYATIQFLGMNDSLTRYGAITNENGIFSIDSVNFADYLIKVSCVGFKTNIRTQHFDKQKKETYLSAFTLNIDNVQLSAIEITGKASRYYELADKTVFYPDSISLKTCKNGIDLIKKLPEIQVDKRTEAIRVLGSSNVLVLINGINNSRSLKAISPDDIDRIELITHPSAKYRSDITSVVNVILKDKRKQGLSVFTDLSICVHQKNHFANAQITYTINKWQIFLNYRAMLYQSISNDTTKRNDYSENNTYTYLSFADKATEYNRSLHRIQYGIDFFPNKKTTINLTGQLILSNTLFDSQRKMIAKTNQSLFRTAKSTYLSENNSVQQNYTLFFEREFSNENSIIWNTNFYFLNDIGSSNITDTSNYTAPSYITSSQRDEFSAYNQFSVNSKIDYNHPITERIKFETGYQFYNRKILSDINSASIYSVLNYYDIRNSIYGNALFEYNTIGIQVGLRSESLNIQLYDTVRNHYIKLLPSASLIFRLKPKHNIRLSYNQRLNYPSYYLLNPYNFYSSDSLSLRSGNPYLLPENTHILKTTYSYKNKKFNTSFSIEYRNVTNIIVENITVENGIIQSKFENLGRVNQYGMNLNIYAVLFNFMELESYLYLAYNSFEGRSDYNGLAYNGGISAYVPLPWDIDFEMTFIMESKKVDYNGYSTSNTIIDELSISKSVLNDNGSIGISVWEPFFRARENEYIWSPSYSDESKWVQTNNTCVMLNFSYFINKGKKVKKSNKKLEMENYDRSHKK